MYGVINRSLREMVVGQFGQQRWESVLKRSGVPDDSFLSMRSYDDSITYSLAQACSEELELDLTDALRAFGVHWIEHTLSSQYDSLARSAGSSLIEFLKNLNALHDRISSTFLDYQPPEFHLTTLEDGRFELLYVSLREGLTPFVEGLIHGLAARFDEPVIIETIETLPVASGEKTRFFIKLEA